MNPWSVLTSNDFCMVLLIISLLKSIDMSLVNYTRCPQACSSHATLLVVVVVPYVNPESLRGEWENSTWYYEFALIWFVIWICHGPWVLSGVSLVSAFKKRFIYFLTALDIHCCTWAFSTTASRAIFKYGARTSHCGFCCCGSMVS